MSIVQKFELGLPFHQMRVDAYEGRIKRYVQQRDKGAISFSQIAHSFLLTNNWQDLQQQDSVLTKLFHDPLMQEKNGISVDRCLLLGLVLCRGNTVLKARVFYDILQDALQDSIAAEDKDFRKTFVKLIEVAVYLMVRMCNKYQGSTKYLEAVPKLHSKQFEQKIDDLLEVYQNTIYQSLDSRVSRVNFIKRTATLADYVLDSEKLRKQWYLICT